MNTSLALARKKKLLEIDGLLGQLARTLAAGLLVAALGSDASAAVATITAPASVTAGQAGYAASVPTQAGVTYSWSISNGSILVGAASDSIAFVAGPAGIVGLSCTVTDNTGAGVTGTASIPITAAIPPRFNLTQALTDGAQRTTLGFDGLGMITGNLQAQSFFPPGKVADYWGFQYLRDNDPDDMGHNTSFLTRVACNVIFILSDSQLQELKDLAAAQVGAINAYAYQRYVLMKTFRRLVDGDIPTGSGGLDATAVARASRDLYRLDGQISFDRAALYSRIYRSLTADQKTYLGAMAGKGWASWPAKTMDDVRERLRGLSNDESVAVMTYASDLFSWYAGSLTADVYFCPERHGTYFGSFYMKDAPAIGHEGYSIDEQLTATAGSALCDSSRGYVTAEQAAIVSGLVDVQRDNLYAGPSNMVAARTAISTALRSLITSTAPSTAFLEQVRAAVLEQSGLYGELDGENVAAYATAFARVNSSLTAAQRAMLADLRHAILSGTYADGTPFDFTVCNTFYLYAAAISDLSTLTPYISGTDSFFASPGPIVDTGQLVCYDTSAAIPCPAAGQPFLGQDAQRQVTPSSYIISADGRTVFDNNTGLTWQRSPDTNGDGSITMSDKLTWAQAQARPAALNASIYGGFNDWRLPTIKELYSLIDFRGTDPSGYIGSDTSGLTPFIDTTAFLFAYGQISAGERIIDSQYASSTLYVFNPSDNGTTKLFGVNFADGRIKGYDLTMPDGSAKTFFVQCVRGSTGYGVNSFLDNGNQTVTDTKSGLMWTKGDSTAPMTWQEALAWVQAKNAISYLGHSDWRLPNAKELQSLIDYTRSPATTGSAAISPVFSVTQITNEAGAADYPWYWASTTHASYNGAGASGIYLCFGRCGGWQKATPAAPCYTLYDVHGAGAQRSDPKTTAGRSVIGTACSGGTAYGLGPQGDVQRGANFVRLVRDVTTAVVSGGGTICSGGSSTVQAALTGTPPWTVSWSDGVTQTNVTASPATRLVSPAVTTTYTVTGLVDANSSGSSFTGSAVVTVLPRPTAAVSGTATICSGAATTITAVLTGTAPWTVTWSDGVTQSNVASSPSSRSVSPVSSSTYTVTTLADSACTGTSITGSAAITVNPRPAAVVSGTATICPGQSTTLQAALSGQPPWTLAWSDGATQAGITTSPATRSVSPATTTTYTVTSVSDARCSSSGSGSAIVTIGVSAPAAILEAPADGTTGFQGSQLSWIHSASGPYDVYFDTVNPPQKRLVRTSQKMARLPVWFPETNYYWKVVVQGACGTPSTPVGSFRTGPCPWTGASPQVVSPPNNGTALSTAQSLSWLPVPGAAYYEIDLGTANPPAGTYRTANPWETSLQVSLNAGTTYYWRVIAYPVCGSSGVASSEVWSFSTGGASMALASAQPSFINRWNLTSPMSGTGSGFLGTTTLFADSASGPAGFFSLLSATPTSLSGTLTLAGTEPAGLLDVGLRDNGVEMGRLLRVISLRAFTDVTEADWYFESSARIVEAGLMESDADPATAGPQFSPNAALSRAQMAEHLARSYQWWRTGSTGLEPVTCTIPDFPDVPCSHPNWLAIHWIKVWGVTVGSPCLDSPGNCYLPEKSVNRAEMMTFLERLKQGAALSGLLAGLGETDPGCSEPYPACAGWTDAAMHVAGWPRREFNVAFADRVTNGCGGTPGNGLTACVFDPLSRCQIGALLARQLGLVPTP